ncbi:alpha/beta fold hydrolase [Kribbella deserti]|uniref:Alpha/beta fold hydrolase n=1 Tax=Kribbella deserti TaxID=1926257 RepID=A0ABV6QTH7_9ACTN
MIKVRSRDGTALAVDRLGDGPAVILVGGASDRSANAPLASLLAEHYTVYNYDRRGRGASDPSPAGTPYSPELELQDLQAVFAATGGSAYLHGASSGAGLALLAVVAGCPAKKLALWDLEYDAAAIGVDKVRNYTTPTLVMTGPAHAREWPPALAGLLENASHLAIDGQDHNVNPAVMATKLREFFA